MNFGTATISSSTKVISFSHLKRQVESLSLSMGQWWEEDFERISVKLNTCQFDFHDHGKCPGVSRVRCPLADRCLISQIVHPI
jgi:hypothetical protein